MEREGRDAHGDRAQHHRRRLLSSDQQLSRQCALAETYLDARSPFVRLSRDRASSDARRTKDLASARARWEFLLGFQRWRYLPLLQQAKPLAILVYVCPGP